jgi:hypothetical protein
MSYSSLPSALVLALFVASAVSGDRLHDVSDNIVAEWEHVYILRRPTDGWRAFLAIADGELAAWKVLGTELGARE